MRIDSVDARAARAAILSVVETCPRLEIPVWEYLTGGRPGPADPKAAEVVALTPMAWKPRWLG